MAHAVGARLSSPHRHLPRRVVASGTAQQPARPECAPPFTVVNPPTRHTWIVTTTAWPASGKFCGWVGGNSAGSSSGDQVDLAAWALYCGIIPVTGLSVPGGLPVLGGYWRWLPHLWHRTLRRLNDAHLLRLARLLTRH